MNAIPKHHWYISMNCTYPVESVRQVDLRNTDHHFSYQLIEMLRKATTEEIKHYCLIYVGRGYQENTSIMTKVCGFDKMATNDILAMKNWRFKER